MVEVHSTVKPVLKDHYRKSHASMDNIHVHLWQKILHFNVTERVTNKAKDGLRGQFKGGLSRPVQLYMQILYIGYKYMWVVNLYSGPCHLRPLNL